MPAESVQPQPQIPWRWPEVVLALLVFSAAIFLRLADLGTPSLWYDEILHVTKTDAAGQEPWYRWITGLAVDRENGPLYYATQSLALSVARDEAAIRFMAALAGIATVVLLYIVSAKATRDRRIALIAAGFLAVSPLHVYYSREARPYAAIMLMATILLGLLLARRRVWTTPAAYVACLATAYLGAISAPVLLSFGLLAASVWLWDRRSRVPWPGHYVTAALLGIGIVVVLFPALQRLGRTTGHGEFIVTSPLSVVAADRLLASLTVSGVEWASSTPRTYLILTLALLGFVFAARRAPKRAVLLVGMAILPIAIWLAVLVSLDRWYNIRYTSAGLPAMTLLIALGVVGLSDLLWGLIAKSPAATRVPRVSTIGAFLLAALLIAPGWRHARFEPLQKPDWRGLAGLLADLAADDEPVITQGWWSEMCLRYYLGQEDRPFEIVSSDGDVAKAQQLLPADKPGWLAAAGYVKADEFRRWMHGADPVVRSSVANLELYFHPDFSHFLAPASRSAPLSLLLNVRGAVGHRRDFGDSEILLGSGWSYPETSGDGTSFRWAMAPESELGLLRTDASEALLRLRMLPFPSPDHPAQTVKVVLNSTHIEHLQLDAGWRDYEVAVPGGIWRAGANLVVLRFGWQQSPTDFNPEATDQRYLAVAFDLIEVVKPSGG